MFSLRSAQVWCPLCLQTFQYMRWYMSYEYPRRLMHLVKHLSNSRRLYTLQSTWSQQQLRSAKLFRACSFPATVHTIIAQMSVFLASARLQPACELHSLHAHFFNKPRPAWPQSEGDTLYSPNQKDWNDSMMSCGHCINQPGLMCTFHW